MTPEEDRRVFAAWLASLTVVIPWVTRSLGDTEFGFGETVELGRQAGWTHDVEYHICGMWEGDYDAERVLIAGVETGLSWAVSPNYIRQRQARSADDIDGNSSTAQEVAP